MTYHIQQQVSIPLNAKIEAPISGHPCLPPHRIVFFGAQRRMLEIRQQKASLFEKRPLDVGRRFSIGAVKVSGGKNVHYGRAALRC